MAINFTDSPADGATQVISGRTYTYNSAKNKWDTTATEVVGPTATVYATVDNLPGTATTGDQAFVTATNRLYIWNGTGWYNIALINTNPSISGADSSYALATDGTPTVVTITATDPEGLPITYSIASDTSGNIATVTQNANVFTITPSTSDANAGTFSLTFRASDGVNIATAVSEFTLQFKVQNSNYTTALITSVGTNNQVNNTFVDSSTNSHTITAAGNVTQSTFSPYRHGVYSYHWDGSGTDYFQILSPTAALDFGTGDFTIEMWIWLNDLSAGIILADTRPSETNGNQYIGAFSIGTDGNYQMHTNNVQRIVTTGAPITAGSWHHIALQRNSGTLEAYVDGSRNATASFTQSLDASRWSLFKNSFAGGGVADAGGGYIKDYRIVKGTAVYSGATYDVPTESLTAISGTSLLLFSDNIYMRDEAVGTESITWTNGMYEPFAPYEYNEYSATDNGGSIYFDGSGDYLSSTITGPGTGDFTYEFWYYPTNSSFSGTSFNTRSSENSGADGFDLNLTSGSIQATYTNVIWLNVSTSAIKAFSWNHIALVRNSGTVTIYVNGISVGTASQTSNFSSTSFNLFANVLNGTGLSGNVTDFRYATTAVYTSNFTPPTAPLTAITNTSLLLSGTNAGIIDKSQSVKSLTLNGDVKSSTAQTKYLTSSMYFDGTGDYINVNANGIANFGTNDFTIELWAYAISIGNYMYLIEARNSGSQLNAWTLSFNYMGNYNNNILQFASYNGSTANLFLSSDTAFSAGQWTHIAVTRSGTTMKMFLDGTEVASNNSAGFDFALDQNPIHIGSRFSIEQYFNGYMSDIRITKGLARYTANFTPPTAALQG